MTIDGLQQQFCNMNPRNQEWTENGHQAKENLELPGKLNALATGPPGTVLDFARGKKTVIRKKSLVAPQFSTVCWLFHFA